MKICFLAAANSIHSYRWVKYFADHGCEVVWISLVENIFDHLPGTVFHEIPCDGSLVSVIRAGLEVKKILKHEQPDVLHVHYVGTNGMVGVISGFPCIVSTPWGSDVIFGGKSFLKRPWIRAILKRSALITCDAWHMAEAVKRLGIPAEKIRIVNFGIDTERFRPGRSDPEFRERHDLVSVPVVVSLRNFEPVYDISTLLRAVPHVLRKHPEARFVIVGKGPLESQLKSEAAELGIGHAVRFLGFIPNDRLPGVLCELDIYVSTSLSDAGIAASTAEAMACGLPVVVTDSGENGRWISDGENGFLVPVSRPEAIAERINRLIDDTELRERLGRAGREKIRGDNDYEAEMRKMDSLYRSLVRSR